MQFIKVASASLNQTPLDWQHNSTNILNAIQEAKLAGVQVLCCPELCVTGYGCEDMFFSPWVAEKALEVIEQLAPVTTGMIVAVGLPVFYKADLYNAACLLVDGKIAGFVAKQHLANSGVYYETRWFKAWPAGAVADICFKDRNYPLGDWVFDCAGLRIGFEICEDAWVPMRTGIRLKERDVDLILNPSASHFAFGKATIRKKYIMEAATHFKVGYIYSNLLGNEAGRLIYDGDTLIAADGKWLAEGKRFSFQEKTLTTAIIEIDRLRQERNVKRLSNIQGVIYIPFKLNKELQTDVSNEDVRCPIVLSKEEEFGFAVALGLFDYLRKSRSRGFIVNLSGGADSAACVCLVYLMVHFAFQELGERKFQNKLAYLFNDQKYKPGKNQIFYLAKILNCLYQGTPNNTETTWQAAYNLTRSLGIPLFRLEIDSFVKNYCQLIEPIIDRALNWAEDDLTLQNIQARVRGPSAWLLANVKNCILLSTSNRSEAAVGYATMDGDTCGGLSPIAGIDKSFILKWLQWLETLGFADIGPLEALREINLQKPTAELRPPSFQQTDEEDLMHYVWLDSIEQLFLRSKYSPLQILLLLIKQYPREPQNVLATYIERFFIGWTQSQWKRERLAPSFHLDEESVDPKYWCRFPILSGGFKQELKEMWDYLNGHINVDN